jgi:hypothetical protein
MIVTGQFSIYIFKRELTCFDYVKNISNFFIKRVSLVEEVDSNCRL